jgi:hypothetical protein
MPHGHLIAELLYAGLQGDQLAAVKAGCLLPDAGDVSGALSYIASQEVGQETDVAFWEAVGGLPALPGDAGYRSPGVRTTENAGCPPEWWAAMDAIAPKHAAPRTPDGIEVDSLSDWGIRDAVVRSTEITRRVVDR